MALLLVAYFFALGLLTLFGVHRLVLVRAARKARRRGASAPPPPVELPHVVVQLPIYNEAFVAERAMRAAAALRYPREKLEIQVLDDSTDATRAVIDRAAAELARGGVRIEVVRRPSREGFKAGALAFGLSRSDAEVVAIFDADFIPPQDFLERTLPVLLADPRCGMVQARWAHTNRERSPLTRAQALYLDGHFGIEHLARDASGMCFNFNGTAGIWRRAAIEGAGGWAADTITEDLDLSYRAQLAGWRFRYLDGVLVPAELPESWTSFCAQQARWVRGSVETARKLLGGVARASAWPPARRFEAVIHLTSNFTYVLMALIAVLLPATVVARDRLGWLVPGGQTLLSILDVSMLTAGTLAMVVFYATALDAPPRRGRLRDLPFALCVGAGMSLSNGREVLRGLTSRGSEFVRTPKRGDTTGSQLARTYRSPPRLGLAVVELIFAAYHAAAILYAISASLWGAIPFLLFYAAGFAAVGGGVIRESSFEVFEAHDLGDSPVLLGVLEGAGGIEDPAREPGALDERILVDRRAP